VVIDESESQNVEKIRDAGYAVSQVNCTGKDNAKKLMLFIEVDKQHLNDLKEIVKKIDKDAFLIINETKYVENGFFK
jgi:hypothetical protein